MHELSIASAVLDIVCRHAGDRRVARVELKVGHLRQVVPSALEFAFGLVAEVIPTESPSQLSPVVIQITWAVMPSVSF